MTAWILTQGEYSEYRVIAVFPDEATAASWVTAMNDHGTNYYPYEMCAVPSIESGATPEIEVELRFDVTMDANGTLVKWGHPVDEPEPVMEPRCAALGDAPVDRCTSRVRESVSWWSGHGQRPVLRVTVYGSDHHAVRQTFSNIVSRARSNLSTMGRFSPQGEPVIAADGVAP